MNINESTIIYELSTIKKAADGLIGKSFAFVGNSNNMKICYLQISCQADEIIKEFNWNIPYVNNFFSEIGVDLQIENIKLIGQTWEQLGDDHLFKVIDNSLTQVSLKCGRILAILKNQSIDSSENKNKFQDLKKEIRDLSKIVPSEVVKNLDIALKDFELNRLLGTTLICGRISIYLLDSISGDMEEKIKKIKGAGLLSNKGSDENLIKANKKMRGLFAHDLNFIPTPSETLAIFGDTINIIKVINEYKSKLKK